MNDIVNIIGYKFTPVHDLPPLKAHLLNCLGPAGKVGPAGVLGTVLIAEEGINVALAGGRSNIEAVRTLFLQDPLIKHHFGDIWFKESHSTFTPFSKLKVRIRPEIIAFDAGETEPHKTPAPNIAPEQVCQWLEQGKQFLLLDTRNNYEIESGTFEGAIHLDIETFRDFGAAASRLSNEDKKLPVVAFCTGGIRCEKAGPWLLANGFNEVYQLEGGILNYFDKSEGKHWHGDCFVFDDRVTIDTNQQSTGAFVCRGCHRAVPRAEHPNATSVTGHELESCSRCAPMA